MAVKKPNKALLKKVLKTIKENPEHWNQTYYHCGTSHCFAGFVELEVLKLPIKTDEYKVSSKTQKLFINDGLCKEFNDSPFVSKTAFIAHKHLGLTVAQAKLLFKASNSLSDLERIVKKFCEVKK